MDGSCDKDRSLYSRISFLSIFSSNLDEFFRVRMPAIFAFSNLESKKISLEEEYPRDLVQQVQATVFEQLEEFGRFSPNRYYRDCNSRIFSVLQ
ncbi:MAG: hypothetical protein IPH18_18155 [Chitinophagaceae bacterium]|nr:hypothetical protein [Chitinophagaceae bacterium]